MEVIDDARRMREVARSWRLGGEAVALVPTMGALHDGHLDLVRAARRGGGQLVVSIFVNPLQFGPGEDFERYPRDLPGDLDRLGESGVDAVFTPRRAQLYPADHATRVVVGGELGRVLEARVRPGHFEGVATVVAKLFHLCLPTRAYFGRKDAQQLAVVRRMVADLDFDVQIEAVPTRRQGDGLALSSRNRYLTPAGRSAALCLVRALRAARELYQGGERDTEQLERAMTEVVAAEPLASLDYARTVDAETFAGPGPLAVIAARVEGTRLIDNLRLDEP